MTGVRASRGCWVFLLSATLAVGVLLGAPSRVLAWPVSPSIETDPCGPAEWCSDAGSARQPEGATGGAAAGANAGPGDARSADEEAATGFTSSSPSNTTASPSSAAAVAAPVGDADEPRTQALELVPDPIVMIDVGLHKWLGDSAAGFDPGLRAGLLVGGRMGRQVSGNAELVVDLLSPDTPNGVSVTELVFDLTFSPLLHMPLSATSQVIFGPRLGVFYLYESVSTAYQDATARGWGWATGLNVGILGALDAARIGFLSSFNVRKPVKVCGEYCSSDGLDPAKMWGLAVLVML
jgi:hypothetical protein